MSQNVPAGFQPFNLKGYFYDTIGPLYMKRRGVELSLGFRVADKHVNIAGICHGGMLMSFMDVQLGFTAAIAGQIDGFVPTINMTSDFVAPAVRGQWVQSYARLVKKTRRLGFVDGHLTADDTYIFRANGIVKIPSQANGFPAEAWLPQETA